MAIITVDDDRVQNPSADFTTIQAAINAANPGDTIIVAVGTYNEQITINKALTILGAQANINPVTGGRPGGESTIDSRYSVVIAANNVIFNGFEIRDFRYAVNIPAGSFVAQDNVVENITIAYNWIHSTTATVGFNAEPGTLRNLTINNNIISVDAVSPAYALAVIGFSSGATTTPTYENIIISENHIANYSDYYGIFAGANPDAYVINSMEITCNHFQNTSDGANFNIGNIRNGIFKDNVVEDIGGTIGIDTGVISGNTFKNGGNLSLWGTDFGFTRPSRDVSIEDNLFTNEIYGRALRMRPGVLSDTITIHENAFLNSGIEPSTPPDYSTGYIIRNEGIGTLNASLNWWGSSLGPAGNAGGLQGPIIVSPWITEYTLDATKQAPPTCWPLSTFMTVQPGFWSIFVTDISYIGKKCFRQKECIVLFAQLGYYGGDGSCIPVTFELCNKTTETVTGTDGIVYACINKLCPGEYKLKITSGGVTTTQVIVVDCLEY